jgi:hypothetical protein
MKNVINFFSLAKDLFFLNINEGYIQRDIIRFRQRFYAPGKTGCLPYNGCLNRMRTAQKGCSLNDTYYLLTAYILLLK